MYCNAYQVLISFFCKETKGRKGIEQIRFPGVTGEVNKLYNIGEGWVAKENAVCSLGAFSTVMR